MLDQSIQQMQKVLHVSGQACDLEVSISNFSPLMVVCSFESSP